MLKFYASSKWIIWLSLMIVAVVRMPGEAQTSLNVTNFGAVGDAVQFHANTVSNSMVVTTTNQLSTADIGKAIEVFGAGVPTYAPDATGTFSHGNEDLVATITNVIQGTNIYLDQICWNTLTNTFATYGHDNTTYIQKAIMDATGSNSIVKIPAGEYLLLAHTNFGVHGYFFSSLLLNSGGLHLIGDGTNNTILLCQGAWRVPRVVDGGETNQSEVRNWLITIVTPITNDFPISIENLTLDGGVEQGYTGNRYYPASAATGEGWDGNHDAIVVYGSYGNTFTDQTWSNVMFTHWRGEMVKSTDGSTNGNLKMVNCTFRDGNATAINYYASLNVTNCLFDYLSQIAEYYQAFYTNTSYFQNNLCTNILTGGFAVNGGKGNNPPLIVQNNIFYSSGGNTIMTTPGDNVYVISNRFISQAIGRLATGISLGCPGYQGTFDNSNIVINANSFLGMNIALTVVGGTSPSDPQRVEDITFNNNTSSVGNLVALQTYGWTTNVTFESNYFGGDAIDGFPTLLSGADGAQYVLVQNNNNYWSGLRDQIGVTNVISYSNGSRYETWYTMSSNAIWILHNSDSNQIPTGAQIIITNANWSGIPINIYLSDSMRQGQVLVPYRQQMTFRWNGSLWTTNMLVPPTDLHLTR